MSYERDNRTDGISPVALQSKFSEDFWSYLTDLIGGEGPQALNNFAKKCVLGAAREKGFQDNRNLGDFTLFSSPVLNLGQVNVLVRFSWLKGRIWRFDFGSGLSVGKSTGSGHVSSPGRRSEWVAEQAWAEHNVCGAVLVGHRPENFVPIDLMLLSKTKFLANPSDRFSVQLGSNEHKDLVAAWSAFVPEGGFSSILGGGST